MKLYYSKGTCSLAVRIIIHEIGISCEYEAVNLRTKKTEFNRDFFKINPKGTVPFLITDNNELLSENGVIQQYLADQYNAVSLLPPLQDFKRYRVLEWLNYVSTEMHKTIGMLFNVKLPQEMKNIFVIPMIETKLDFLNKHLRNTKYLAGENFSLADAYAFTVLSWLANFQIEINDKWPNVGKYFANIRTRQSINKSLEEEGLLQQDSQ